LIANTFEVQVFGERVFEDDKIRENKFAHMLAKQNEQYRVMLFEEGREWKALFDLECFQETYRRNIEQALREWQEAQANLQRLENLLAQTREEIRAANPVSAQPKELTSEQVAFEGAALMKAVRTFPDEIAALFGSQRERVTMKELRQKLAERGENERRPNLNQYLEMMRREVEQTSKIGEFTVSSEEFDGVDFIEMFPVFANARNKKGFEELRQTESAKFKVVPEPSEAEKTAQNDRLETLELLEQRVRDERARVERLRWALAMLRSLRDAYCAAQLSGQ